MISIYSIIFGLHTTKYVYGQCLKDQDSLLLAFKSELIYDSSLSTKIAGWNTSVDCCHWGGVTCDKAGHVIVLDLSYESINSGTLPDSIGGLKWLSRMELRSCGLSGQIPDSVQNLTRLEYLDLSSNLFIGSIPSLQSAKNLVSVGLHQNNLTGNVPSSYLEGLNKLEYLDLSSNSLGGGFPESVLSLPSLQSLYLSNNTFSGQIGESINFSPYCQMSTQISSRFLFMISIYSIIFGLHTTKYVYGQCLKDQESLLLAFKSKLIYDSSLSTKIAGWNTSVDCCHWGGVTCDKAGHVIVLDLSYESINSGTLPDSIGGLKWLSRMELRSCGLSGQIPDSVQNLTRLEYLDLSSNLFIGSIPSLQAAKNLVSVGLHQNNLTGNVPSSYLEGLNKLEYLDLSSNSLGGGFPESVLSLPSLQSLYLSNNTFSGQIGEPINVSCYQLQIIDLSSNKFDGPIPEFIFKLPLLSTLMLSANNFTGIVDLDMFGMLKELNALELSFNDLTVIVNANSSSFSSLYKLNSLKLASCKMLEFPDLKNQSGLMMLDLSVNELTGEIPNWIWEVGDGNLRSLNLSHKKLSSLQKPYTFPSQLDILDLHSNNLQGDIPIPSKGSYILDYSNNNFGSSFAVDFGNFLTSALFFSIKNSTVVGPIPQTICNASSLLVLDLSHNSLSGMIPSCLAETSKTLRVLNLGKNNLSGNVLDLFPETCDLKTLDLSGNHLQGTLPLSLMNCKNLDVLDLSDNLITGTFPCWLSNLSNLHVFVIRSNSFYGNISCPGLNGNWTNLQIIDIASNRFSGVLPPKLFTSFRAVMDNQAKVNYLHYVHPANSEIYYQDSATVFLKGTSREFVKILNIFTSIDFSNNSFQGSIPVTIGDLKLLELLNLSHNALTGPIPPSMGKLESLESLDISVNNLSGRIPHEIASLSFLSFLNLSNNQLSGRIPRGSQFQTFTELSFKGNQGLCGVPLRKICDNDISEIPTKSSPKTSDDADNGTDLFISIGLGFFVGFAIIVGPLVFLKRWRTWYNNHVDRLLLRIFKTKGEQTRLIFTSEQEESTF
ncbi:leucine-rich repeat protein [Artemisia annua]|uniref:Leucine-rich repeat protein n=1 Tax=Artemisia annua TaxID=35608 RepID=A0A2U1PTY9_ARTAN|nr:leucine-rich repeat protein [Artemisia annua]